MSSGYSFKFVWRSSVAFLALGFCVGLLPIIGALVAGFTLMTVFSTSRFAMVVVWIAVAALGQYVAERAITDHDFALIHTGLFLIVSAVTGLYNWLDDYWTYKKQPKAD